MQYDGSINIDTRVDTKGMNKGTKSIAAGMGNVLRSIKAVGAALGLAFSGAVVINFIKKTLEQFDLMNSSVGGKIKELKDSFEGLKGALANTVLTLFAALQPYIIAAVQWLTQMLNTLTAIITALFGVERLTGGAAANTEDLQKNAKGALASFDQINVLGGGDKQKGPSVLPTVTIPPELLAKVEEFKKKMLDFLEPVIAAWDRLKKALEPLGKTIWAGLEWAWEHILVPLGEWVTTEFLPNFMELLAQAADTLNEALIALEPVWQDFYDDFLKPVADWAGGKIIEFLDWLTEKLEKLGEWIKENPEKFREFAIILGIVALAFKVLGIIAYIVGSIISAWTAIVSVATAVIALITSPIFLIIAALALLVVALIGTIGWFMYLKRSLPEIWEAIKAAWASAGAWFQENVTTPIRNTFTELLFNIATGFMTVFGGIKDYVVGVVNDIINIINDAINGIAGGLLGATGTFGIGFVTDNKSNDTLAPRIPRLATGAVIPPNAEFAAILGDQRSGRNLEAPEGLIRQIIREEMGGSNGAITVQMPVYLDSEKVYEGVKKVEIRRGPSLISGA